MKATVGIFQRPFFYDDNQINEKPKFKVGLRLMKTRPVALRPNEIGATPVSNSGAKFRLWITVDNLGDKWHNGTVEKL